MVGGTTDVIDGAGTFNIGWRGVLEAGPLEVIICSSKLFLGLQLQLHKVYQVKVIHRPHVSHSAVITIKVLF